MNKRAFLAAVSSASIPWPAWAQESSGAPDLSRYPVGPLPPEFLTAWRTGQGSIGDWRVVNDGFASQGNDAAYWRRG